MENIWWRQVTNAVNFISDIQKNLLDEKSILIRHIEEMPWQDRFREIVQESVKLQTSDKKFEDIAEKTDPGEYLLREFCKKEKRAEFRPMKGYAKFLAESEDIVLHDRYLWVNVSDEDSLAQWLKFVAEYIKERGKDKKTAVFILEWEGRGTVSLPKGIKGLSFDDYIGEYDRIVFAVLASSNMKVAPFLQDYAAELVSNIAGNDIELCAACIAGGKEFLNDPITFLKKTEMTKIHSSGVPFILKNSDEELIHLIWRAQIKTVYPFLEEYREDFVRSYEKDLAKQLPIQASYGETYTDPKDVELGTLWYMASNGYLSISPKEYSRLRRFKEARNKLAHLAIMEYVEVEELL